jgi:UrcA family protein
LPQGTIVPVRIPSGALEYLDKLEITMIIKSGRLKVQVGAGIAAVAVGALLCAPIQAKEHEVTVTVPVATAGLDTRDPATVRELYRRLRLAAQIACSHGNRVDLKPLPSFAGCFEQALGNAVHSIAWPQLNAVYLETHLLHDAATYGIDVPVQMAAK